MITGPGSSGASALPLAPIHLDAESECSRKLATAGHTSTGKDTPYGGCAALPLAAIVAPSCVRRGREPFPEEALKRKEPR